MAQNLPAILLKGAHNMFDIFWWNCLTLGIGAFAIYWLAVHYSRKITVTHGVVLVALLMGVAGYSRFGQIHGGGHTYHYSEVWHYYLGSKYYKEVSSKYLYVTIIGAFDELSKDENVPHPPAIRNLNCPYNFLSPQEALTVFRQEVRSHFSEQRWTEFKQDIHRFLSVPWTEGDWRSVADVGYNPPPTFSVVVGQVAGCIPINSTTMTLIPFIDVFMILLGAFVIFRTFGFLPASVFLLVFLTNNLAGMHWIGGSFCRYLWVTALTLGLCALHTRRFFLAGSALGFATAMRVFPAAFLVAACIPYAIDALKAFRLNWRKPAMIVLGACTVCLPLFLLSLLLYPPHHWVDFASKILPHSKIFFVMHLGYDKIASNTYALAPQFLDEGFNFENWNIVLNDRFNEHWIFNRVVSLLFLGWAVFVALKADPKMACLLVGETMIFFFALPANYYYIYLAAFAAITVTFLQQSASQGNSLRYWTLIGFLTISNLAGGFSRDWIKLNWCINVSLLILLIIYISSQIPFDKSKLLEDIRLRVGLTIASLLLVAAFTFHPRQLGYIVLSFKK